MSDLDVRIEELEPMHVASFRVVSENPEQDAWKKLTLWADVVQPVHTVCAFLYTRFPCVS